MKNTDKVTACAETQSRTRAFEDCGAKPLSRLAFTLAEVLIVLGIIGIIADMTIPTLKRDIDKIVYVTQLKKFYSAFQQGMQMLMVTEGTSTLDGSDITTGNSAKIATEMKKVFNIVNSGLFGNLKISYKDLSGGANVQFDKTDPFFVLADGSILFPIFTSCQFVNNQSFCGFLSVDVNGIKKPNVFGKDVFLFSLNAEGILYPAYGKAFQEQMAATTGDNGFYWELDAQLCGAKNQLASKTSNVSGDGCAGRLFENGWVIDYY